MTAPTHAATPDRADHFVATLLRRAAAETDRPALLVAPNPDVPQFEPITWGQLADRVRRLAAALADWGVTPGDRVALWSENRWEWIVADLAIQAILGVSVPLHTSLSGRQAGELIAHSGSRVALIAGPQQGDKLADALRPATFDVRIMSFDRCETTIGDNRPAAMAEVTAAASPSAVAQIEAGATHRIDAKRLATIIYTSGTTGQPKGVMLTHGNLATNARAMVDALGQRRDDVRLCLLPLSHVYARTCDLNTWLLAGLTLALARRGDTLAADCAAVQPTLFNAVPYVFQRTLQTLGDCGLDPAQHGLRTLLGGRIRICCSGGAPLPAALLDTYARQGLPILEGYGLTESSPVITAATPRAYRQGTVGPAVDGVELRIADDGEILTRGPHVMAGYWRDPTGTAEVLRDGWLHTGDVGHLDANDLLTITGRRRELIVTSGGKNVSPLLLESQLTADPLIHQAVVIGEGRSYLTALVVPEFELLRRTLATVSDPHTSPKRKRGNATGQGTEASPIPSLALRASMPAERLIEDAGVVALFRDRIDACLAELARDEQIRRFTLLAQPLSVETGELSPKLSLRRAAIQQRHARTIDAMYDT